MEGREARRGLPSRDRGTGREAPPRGDLHLINLDGWGFIVRKEAEKQEKRLSFAEAYDQIAANVQKTERKTRYAAWIARLRDLAFIKRYPIPSEK